MPDDASLDQFASSDASDASESDSSDSETVGVDDSPEEPAVETGDDSETESATKSEMESATDSEIETGDDSTAELDDLDVEPAVSTFEWSPEGGECTDCGALAERRWRSEGQRDGGLVCADCKDW